MLEQARATKNLRLLVACRSHDLEHDRRLRQLLHGRGVSGSGDLRRNDLVEVPMRDLSLDEIRGALRRIGLAPDAASATQLALLSNAFNLGLLAWIVRDQTWNESNVASLAAIHTQHDLLAEYHRRQNRRLRQTLSSDVFAQVVFRIAQLLSDSGCLSIESTALADMPDTIDALVHEGVLANEGRRLRFFHEAYFDYVFALRHVQSGRTAADLIEPFPVTRRHFR